MDFKHPPYDPADYDKRYAACRKEVDQLRELINEYDNTEEAQTMSLNCEICGAEIDTHYGEITVSIQPHAIRDGSFWTIDSYVADVLNRKIVCEPCIIHLKRDHYDIDGIKPYTIRQLWMLTRQTIGAWFQKERL